jgi:hypothetical protein
MMRFLLPDFLYAALDPTACAACQRQQTPQELQASRRLASVPDVVRMPSKYCKCPVELFGQHQASEFVGQRHWTQRQHRLGLPPIRPAIRRPNGENNHLLA